MLSDGTYSKLCDADDFPALTGHFAAVGDTLTYHRKQWEYAMVLRNMEALSALHDKADVLGLACETEPVIYYAAARARSVLATDLYQGEGGGDWKANQTRIDDVYGSTKLVYPRERLSVRNMDMRHIDAPDESFDLVWSCCAIEHVDTIAELQTVLTEVSRVLRPGGIHVFTTDWKLWGGYSYFPNAFVFDRPLLERTLKGVKLAPIGPIDLSFSRNRLNTPLWRGLRPIFEQMSHIVLYSRGVLHVSVAFAFKKSDHAGHHLDFINEDPDAGEWLNQRFVTMKRTVASPMTRARLMIDGTLGASLAKWQNGRNERREALKRVP
jgi:SAM-dependent methyltransferase